MGGRQRSAFNATAAGVPYNGDGGGDTESHGTGSRGRTARVRPWNSSGSGLPCCWVLCVTFCPTAATSQQSFFFVFQGNQKHCHII